MVNKILIFVLIGLLAVIIVVGWLNHQAKIREVELKAQYEALSDEYEARKVEALQDIADLRNIISQKDDEIRNITAQIEVKTGEISHLHAQTDKLEEAYVAQLDNEAKIVNLKAQVAAWKQKFTLAEAIIADKDKIIFSLNKKYEAQVDISVRWENLYNNEATLRELCEQRLKLADRRIAKLRFGGTVKTGLAIGLAAVVVYGLVRE